MENVKQGVLVFGLPLLIVFAAAWQFIRPDRRLDDGAGTERLIPMIAAIVTFVLALLALIWVCYWTRWDPTPGERKLPEGKGFAFLYRHTLGLHKDLYHKKANPVRFLAIAAFVSGAVAIGFAAAFAVASNQEVGGARLDP